MIPISECSRMPRTESNPIELGAKAPDFVLPDADGRLHRLADVERAPALLVAFISNRCPFVLLIREELARLGRDYADQGPGDRRDQRERRRGASRGDARADRRGGSRARLRLPLPQGRGPGGRQGLRRRLHAGPLPLRRRPAPRLSRPVRRRAAGQRQAGDRRRPARRRRRRARRRAPERRAGPVDRLQHQVAGRQRAGEGRRRGLRPPAGRGGVPPFHFHRA